MKPVNTPAALCSGGALPSAVSDTRSVNQRQSLNPASRQNGRSHHPDLDHEALRPMLRIARARQRRRLDRAHQARRTGKIMTRLHFERAVLTSPTVGPPRDAAFFNNGVRASISAMRMATGCEPP
jgi:hypothetical protein